MCRLLLVYEIVTGDILAGGGKGYPGLLCDALGAGGGWCASRPLVLGVMTLGVFAPLVSLRCASQSWCLAAFSQGRMRLWHLAKTLTSTLLEYMSPLIAQVPRWAYPWREKARVPAQAPDVHSMEQLPGPGGGGHLGGCDTGAGGRRSRTGPAAAHGVGARLGAVWRQRAGVRGAGVCRRPHPRHGLHLPDDCHVCGAHQARQCLLCHVP